MINLKQKLHSGKMIIGTFVKTPSPMLCEVLAQTALEVMCLDAEHSPFDRLVLDQCIFALRHGNMPSLVRVPSAAPEHLLNALDCGATGVVVPHVKTLAMAEELAANAHFGAGGRGYAGSTRAASYGGKSIAEHKANSANNTVVIAQIEDIEALDNIEAIAAVEGIDCLFIGMIDLTVALGVESAKAPEVVAAAEKICVAAVKANRRLGIFVPDVADIPFWQARGVSLFLMASDHAFIKQGASQLVSAAKANT